jgi:nitrate/TMAO reductase-like tetraheme cytochrome c subunit
VTVAQIKCQTCHGPMETLSRPPVRPLKQLAMEDCIACHERRLAQTSKVNAVQPTRAAAQRVATDCITCHR